MIRMLPNALSLCRILLSLMLPFLTGRPVAFIFLYAGCGLSDVLDGYIARRFHVQSDLGARLDTLGDLVFYLVTICILVFLLDVAHNVPAICSIALVIALRFANIAYTRLKFGLWGSVHTIANKAAGLLIFYLLPVYVYLGALPKALLWVMAVASALAALEESLIIHGLKAYNHNIKSIFHVNL